MNGIDYSWARPGGAAIKAAGFEFVMRYCPYPSDGGKGLTIEEIADLRANGLAIGLCYESTAGRVLEGAPAGVADAQQYTRSILALGYPVDLPCFFTIDFDAQPRQYQDIAAYFAGAGSVLGKGRLGAYGHDGILTALKDIGLASWFWQTTAWSGGRIFLARHLFQMFPGGTINGGAVDYNTADNDGAGWLWTTEDDMEDTVLRDAMIKREKLRHAAAKIALAASDPDLVKVEKAHAALVAAGVIV